MSSKIVRCKLVDNDGALVPTPRDGQVITDPIVIAPDDSGELWYWTPDDSGVSTNA